MAGELDSLIIRLAAETADAQRQLGRMERSVDKFADKTQRQLTHVDKAFSKMEREIASVAGRLIGIFAVDAITSWADQIVRANNAMADMADTVGLTAGKFQELRVMGAEQGMGLDKIEVALRGFAVRMGEARGQAGGFYEFLTRHVPTLQRQLLATKDQAEALAVIESAFERLKSPAHRAALANQAFGEAGLQLAPILAQAGSQIDKAGDRAKKYGIVISDDAIKQTREMQKELDILSLRFKKLAVEGIASAYKEFQTLSKAMKESKSFFGQLSTLAEKPLTALQIALGSFKELAAGAGSDAITKPSANDKSNGEALGSRLAGFVLTGFKDAAVKKPPLKWNVKLRPMDTPQFWKATVEKFEDPFTKIYEKAREAQDRFIEEARSSFDELAGVIANGLGDPLRDAFAGNLQDTKTYLRNLISGLGNAVIQATLLKPIIDAIKNSLAGAGTSFSSLFSGIFGSFGGFLATGGQVSPGKSYVVGEKGPELFVPKQSGSIVPNNEMGRLYAPNDNFARGGGGQSVSNNSTVYNIDARGAAPGVEERIYARLAELERQRPTAPAQMATYGRRYPLRAA